MNRIQVNLRALPSHVLDAVCRPDPTQSARSMESTISPITFPKSKMHLWDPTPTGDRVNLHLSYYRKPRLLLTEKAMRLAHRHARQSKKPQFSCFLLGTLAVEMDEEGVTITLDRFDPGREQPDCSGKSPTALLPGDVLVPCTFHTQHVPDTPVFTAHDLDNTFKMLEHSCSSREVLDLWKLMSLCVRLSVVENMDRLNFTLHWGGVTLASSLEAFPVRVLPVIPTALARNLSSPASIAQPLHSQSNGRKRGFLSMDQTRKLLLLLESDPKAYTLPLVGIWLSGVTHIQNPVVWAWCLRYLYSSSLHDRVMSEDDSFLVVLYSLTHRDPEFYQCKLPGLKDMSFQLLSSTESLTLYKNVEPAEGRLLQFELGAEGPSRDGEIFKEALSRAALQRSGTTSSAASVQNKVSISDHDSGVEDEDLSPRPSPNPHPISQQMRQVQPSVPELSMLFDGSFLDGKVMESNERALVYPVQSNPPLRSSNATAPPSHPAPAPNVMSGPPPIRRPLTPVLSQAKLTRSQSTSGHQPSMCRNAAASMGRRSSNGFTVSSSSSSSSSPKPVPSPNDSVHEQRSGLPTPPGKSHKSKKVSISAEQTSLLPSQHTVFHSTPALNPPCSCRPAHHHHHHHSHIPVYQGNTWQGASSPPVHCPSEGSPHRECCISPTRPALPQRCRVSPTQSPVCHYSPSRVPHGPNPCAGAPDHTPPVCQAQCCQHQPGPVTAPDVALLPADAYRMLMDQDRQLKQLQAQIQKLLDAQNRVSEPSWMSPDDPQEQAVQTSVLSEPIKKTSVSVAVGTGASLFWSAPEHSITHGAQTPESHPETTSTASSRLHQSSEEQSPPSPMCSVSSPRHSASDVAVSQSPVLGESASMYYNSDSNDKEDFSQNGEMQSQQFYQDLLGQVKTRLQDGIGEEVKNERDVHSPRPSLSPRNSPPKKPAVREQNVESVEEDRVFSATLKQLHNLGVNMELNTGKSNRTTVESASTLACINPEAVIPRLTLSEPVGTSVWGLNSGVDLSLEANAIALKYLSDSQLSRLSLGAQSPGAHANPGTLLFERSSLDKSSTGLSILSSSNMSLATCRYMKKYGLIEGGSSGEEEEECSQRAQADSALGCSLQLETSENTGRETEFLLKNLNNKQPAPLLCTKDSQSLLIRDLKPKMQLLARTKTSPEKENDPKRVHPRPQRRSSLSDNQRLAPVPETQNSVGNFLDLSRLRQLPKLF